MLYPSFTDNNIVSKIAEICIKFLFKDKYEVLYIINFTFNLFYRNNIIKNKLKQIKQNKQNKQNANQFVNVENVVKNESDILFIKYDSANMRYLYKCCVCATHWKNK